MAVFLCVVAASATPAFSAPNGGSKCGVTALRTSLLVLACKGDTRIDAVAAAVTSQSARSNSMQALSDAAWQLGAVASPFQSTSRKIESLPFGAVVHLQRQLDGQVIWQHFSCYLGSAPDGTITLADDPNALRRIDADIFRQQWTGYYVAVFASKDDANRYLRRFSARSWFDLVIGSFVGILALALRMAVEGLWRYLRVPTISALSLLLSSL